MRRPTSRWMQPSLEKLQTAAALDDINVDWALLAYVAEDFQLRRVLLAQTVDVPLVDAIPWQDLLAVRP